MAANRSRSTRKGRLSKAELKAYETRRAEERRRLALQTSREEEQPRSETITYSVTRDDEFGVIQSDLVRLGWIVGILAVLLAAATILLS